MIASQAQDTWKQGRKYLDKAIYAVVPNSHSNWSWHQILSVITSVKRNQWFQSLKNVSNRNTLIFQGKDENENQRMIHGCNIFWLDNDGLWYNRNMSCLHCTLQRDLTGNRKSNYTNTIPEVCSTRYHYRYPVLETKISPESVSISLSLDSFS